MQKTKIVAAAAIIGAAGAVIKKKNICPVCVAKRAISAVKVNKFADANYNNGVALTPPMGWSSWNTIRHRVSENLILEIGDAMVKTGLKDAGYNYVNIDDCWQSSLRDSEGRLQADLTTFPSGIKNLVGKMNEKGLKVGIYSSNGYLTCEDMPASLGNEALDADTFAEWGIEYFKYDFCHNDPTPTAAPEIDKIYIGSQNKGDIIVLEAENGELRGGARIAQDKKLGSGKYVRGLSANGGKIIIQDIEIEEEGEYIITLGLHKFGLWEKYCEITINGTDVYPTLIPSTKGVTHEGRHQITVKLKKGKNSLMINNPIGSRFDGAAKQYTNMGRELKRAAIEYAEKTNTPVKPIVYSICEWGTNFSWKWGASAGNLWRVTPDITTNWLWIVKIYDWTAKLYEHQCIGGWNDPDMLEVGNGELSYDENVSHFSLWCMLSAPLILGNDVRQFVDKDGNVDFDNKILKILTNKELIAVNQDARGIQGRKIRKGQVDILAKPLVNNELAICFFNRSGSEKSAEITMESILNEAWIDLPKAEKYNVQNLWNGEKFEITNSISTIIPSHGVCVFRINAI